MVPFVTCFDGVASVTYFFRLSIGVTVFSCGFNRKFTGIIVHDVFWPIQEVQEPRISGVFFVAGMTVLAATIDYSEGLFRDETAQNSAMAEVEYKRQKILTPDELVIAEQLQSQSYWEPEHCIHDLTSSIPEGFTWIPCNEEPYNTQDPKLYDQLLTLCREADAGHTKAQF